MKKKKTILALTHQTCNIIPTISTMNLKNKIEYHKYITCKL